MIEDIYVNKYSVAKEWLEGCSWKEQTVLFCALRGPDAGGSPEVKSITRWIRSIVLKNAAPHKTFMKDPSFRRIKEMVEERPLIFDMLPVHFLGHLMHAMEVIAYKLKDENANKAWEAYADICEYLHINPESYEQMFKRLKDEI